MLENITPIDNIPSFDWTILGMGEDGHTASLFNVDDNFITQNLTTVTTCPKSGQKRISLSKKTLCASKYITFLVAGKSKDEVVKAVLGKNKKSNDYPAARIKSNKGKTVWVIDIEAGELL